MLGDHTCEYATRVAFREVGIAAYHVQFLVTENLRDLDMTGTTHRQI